MKIFDDAFKFVDTHGLPLHMIMERAAQQGVAINLSAFLSDAVAAGWKERKAIAVANEAVNDLRNEHCLFAISSDSIK